MAGEENIKMIVTEIPSTSNTLSSVDLNTNTELTQQDSSINNSFNRKGIIIGSTLFGAGILCSLGAIISSHSSFNKYKNKTIANKLCFSLAIPLTTAGFTMTTYFVLNKNNHLSS